MHRRTTIIDGRRLAWRRGLRLVAGLLGWAVLGSGSVAAGERIELRRICLCCEECERTLFETLDAVAGVSQVEIDREASRAEFRVVEDEDRAQALEALAAAGFHAEVWHRGKRWAMPLESLDIELRQDRVVFRGVHLCCAGCARTVARAYQKLPEVQAVDCDLKQGTVTLTGQQIPVLTARGRLLEAGLSGTLVR